MDFIVFVPMIAYIAGYMLKYFSTGGEINMDQAIIAALITGGVTVATYGIGLIKNRQMEKIEHDDIKERLTVNSEKMGDGNKNLSEEHHELSEKLIALSKDNVKMANEILGMSNNLSDVNKYVTESRTEKRIAEKNGIDINQIFGQIQAMSAAINNAEAKAAEMERKVQQCELQLHEKDIELKDLYKQIGGLKYENNLLRRGKISPKMYRSQHPDPDEPEL